MNFRTTRIYAAIHDKKIIRIDTTLRGFHNGFTAIEPTFMGYMTLFRKFKETDDFSMWIEGKEYNFEIYTQPHVKRKPHVKSVAAQSLIID